MRDGPNAPALRIFISHSSDDAALAGQLVDLLGTALNLRSRDIRCSSIDGHRLTGGTQVNEHLRRESVEAEVMVALISQTALSSPYVLFELGARWGADKPLIPILASGCNESMLPAPLSSIHALRVDSASELHQLIGDVAALLGVVPEPSAAFQRHIERMGMSFGKSDLSTGPQLLVVDDDVTQASGIFIQLEQQFGARYLVSLADDPQTACQILDRSRRISLCITDLVFRSCSELGGVRVAEAAVRNRVPVMVVTGHAVTSLPVAVNELKKFGISVGDIVAKPITREQYDKFLGKVAAELLRWARG